MRVGLVWVDNGPSDSFDQSGQAGRLRTFSHSRGILRVRLPAFQPESGKCSRITGSLPVHPLPSRVAQMKGTVLIVDDDSEVVTTFTQWLKLEGYQVRTATDGEQALSQVEGTDAVIVDVRMPILDGLGFLRRVRTHHQQVPVAVVTGDYLIDETILKEFDQLNARVLFKPLWVDELVSLATALVDHGAVA
jgi:CheY-like chemotaxis protein